MRIAGGQECVAQPEVVAGVPYRAARQARIRATTGRFVSPTQVKLIIKASGTAKTRPRSCCCCFSRSEAGQRAWLKQKCAHFLFFSVLRQRFPGERHEKTPLSSKFNRFYFSVFLIERKRISWYHRRFVLVASLPDAKKGSRTNQRFSAECCEILSNKSTRGLFHYEIPPLFLVCFNVTPVM